ncbi:uncharacterized protein BKA55DRAFT_539164 [Fusarium redolens]|uniref:Uncharacterized protein n=1 Tax=Fusarium redolens TaxID=48865 RepID=A0A9P9HCV4_FUSRE|nr:uncharacterized protein BKA55DRAFT_539164 [Fusarium redolens]KAH7254332.1 hypothetical protein BKA55DRAFT_539164 [Fusarium redolens]
MESRRVQLGSTNFDAFGLELGFIRRFRLPKDTTIPIRLVYERLIAVPLSRKHLMEDLVAVNSNSDLIIRTRGGSWPPKGISQEDNFLDLAWHEREFKSRKSFAYVIHDNDDSPELIGYDVDVSWWVTGDFYSMGYYMLMYRALKSWIQESFPFEKSYFSNQEIPSL